MIKMSRKLQSVPIVLENSGTRRIDVRHHGVEDSSGLQPFCDPRQNLSRLVQMFEYVKAGNRVETGSGEGPIQNVSNKHLGATFRLRALRHRIGHLDAVELPFWILYRRKKAARTASQIQDGPTR